MIIVSALIIGLALGITLQRGKLCMNLVCGGVTYLTDPKGLKAYILALALATLGTNALEEASLVGDLLRNDFAPLSSILGGLLFGIGMVMAEGCGAAIWYKAGEGNIPSWIAIIGFIFTLAAFSTGPFAEISMMLRGPVLRTSGGDALTLYNIPGFTLNKWLTISTFIILCLWLLIKGRKASGHAWIFTGISIGMIIVLSWYATWTWGEESGISASGPSRDLIQILAGLKDMTWGAYFIIAVPLGSFISAKISKKFRWKSGSPLELRKAFIGGCIMGIGASIAGGCNIRFGLSQFSLLSLAGVVTTLAIFFGHLLMTYYEQWKQEKKLLNAKSPT